jgi:hypothetical protein
MVYNQLTFIHEFITGKGHRRLNVEINIESVQVEGGVRPLRATWTPELAQDLTAYHNIDAEAELTAMLTENLTNEINQEIINNIRDLGERAPQDPIQPRQGRLLRPDEVGDVGQIHTQQQREELVERWRATGLLEGLEHNPNRQNIAQLLESQAQTLINEEPPELNPPQRIEEQIQFPIVRRVHSRLLANDLVTPIGNMRYNEFNHNLGLGGNDHNNNFFGDWLRNYDEQSLEGVTWRTDETWTYETLYGSLIGITMDLEPLKMVQKKNPSLFDLVTLPSVRRAFC